MSSRRRTRFIRSIVIFILVVMTAIPQQTAWGAGDRTAWLTSGEGRRGDTVTVSLMISDIKDIAGVEVTVEYDATRLAIVSGGIVSGAAFTSFLSEKNAAVTPSSMKYVAASKDKITLTGQAIALTMNFVVKPNAPAGNAYVNISDLLITDGSSRLPALTTDGSIAVLDSSGESGGQEGSAGNPSTVEEIAIDIDSGDGSEASMATIRRTTNADGTKRDEGTFGLTEAREAANRAQASGSDRVRIVIPDPKDEVSELDLTIPKAAADELSGAGVGLELDTDNASVVIPREALQGLTEDLIFRFVPLRGESDRTEVEKRALRAQAVLEAASGNDVKAAARPIVIETNLPSGAAVDIVLPLRDADLPDSARERAAYLAGLAVYIEHSDGELELVIPEVIFDKNGRVGLKFGITKFSTFTILSFGSSGRHEAYMNGYPDAAFRPDKAISRAEMATILYRIEAGVLQGNADEPAYFDVDSAHWSSQAIRYAASRGLMNGFPDGTFKPDRLITRAEMATIVSRWLDLSGTPSITYPDTDGHWAQASIALVRQVGVFVGYPDGSFRPDKPLTRAEAVTLINAITGRGSTDWTTPAWNDVPKTHWAFNDVQEASVPHAYSIDASGSETASNN